MQKNWQLENTESTAANRNKNGSYLHHLRRETSKELMEKLLNGTTEEKQAILRTSRRIGPDHIGVAMGPEHGILINALAASHPKIAKSMLDRALETPNILIQRHAARNPSANHEHRKKAAAAGDPTVRIMLLSNQSITTKETKDVIDELWKNRESVIDSLMKRELSHIPRHTPEKLFEIISYSIYENPNKKVAKFGIDYAKRKFRIKARK
jgi:hypothetical protein